MHTDSLEYTRHRLAQFAKARDWERFHSPKNLIMALIGEAAELAEHFQWLTEEQSRNLTSEQLHHVSLEMADVLIYLVRAADQLDVDLINAAAKKIDINEGRFPVEKVRGRAVRGHQLADDTDDPA